MINKVSPKDDPHVAKVMRVLKESDVDDISPFDRLIEKNKASAGSYSALEDRGVVYPEVHLSRGIRALVYTLVLAYILSAMFHPDVFRGNSFIERLGYSNICVGIDLPPARQVAMVGLQLFCFFNLQYAFTDIKRSDAVWKHNVAHGLPNRLWRYRICVAADLLYAFSSIVFCGLVLTYAPSHGLEGPIVEDEHGHSHHRPDSNLLIWTHTGIFIQWIYCLGIMLAVNYWANPIKEKTASRFMKVYIFICIAFPAMLMANYITWGASGNEHYLTPFWFNAVLDWTWVVLTTQALGYLPVGEALVSTTVVHTVNHEKLRAANKDLDAEKELAAPPMWTGILPVLLVPFALFSLSVHIVFGVMKRAVNFFWKSSPFLNPGAVDAEAGASGKVGTRRFVGGFIGDIFGFVSFLANPGMGEGGRCNRWAHGAVYATNVGVPVVMLNDLTASKCYVEGIDNTVDAHDVPIFAYAPQEYNARANFMRKGDHAVKVRQLFKRLVPRDTSDPKWTAAMDAVTKRVRKWATYDRHDLMLVNVFEEFRANLIWLFASHMFLGDSLDLSFFGDNVFPMPQLSFQYPWFPTWLNPAWHRMRSAKKSIWTFMHNCPYAAEIQAAYTTVGLSAEQAFEAILTACTFNANGMGNSSLNLMYFLPHCGEELRQRLRVEDDLLESFCYELLRNNGPMGIMKLKAKTPVTTSAGERYLLKKGTKVCVNNSVTQRDETVYEDPHTFRADRFFPPPPKDLAARDSSNGNEPLPSMAFACQLGKMFDDGEHDAKAHNCVFKHLAVHYLKGLAKVLLDHDYGLDRNTTNAVAKGVKDGATVAQVSGKQGSKCPFAFDISPSNIVGGVDPSFDNTPKIPSKPQLLFFNKLR